MINKYLIEVAVEALDHALRAERHGADRIELCANLTEGGTTPSYGMIKSCQDQLQIPIHVMLRCRAGNFDYSEAEFQHMMLDAEICAQVGVRGVVFGFLQSDLDLDVDKTTRMVEHCHRLGLKTTFHRAIDVCKNPLQTIPFLADIGVENLLTSGTELTAPEGLATIKAFIEHCGDRINIMAGCGINSSNVQRFMEAQVPNIHFTSHDYVSDKLNTDFEFGNRAVFDDQYTIDILHEVRT